MPSFRYRATSASGAVDAGLITARDIAAVHRELRAQNKTPLSITPTTDIAGSGPAENGPSGIEVDVESARALLERVQRPAKKPRAKKRVDANDVLRLTNELSVLLNAGLPLDKAIKVQIDSAPDGPVRSMLETLLENLKGGKALSKGLEQHPGVFSPFYINMVRSGEASGHLSQVLAEMAEYLERIKAIRSSVISALTYPMILALVATASVFIMLGFVVPEFEALFEDMGDSLPLLTALIVALGDWVSAWGGLLFLLLVVVTWYLRRWFRTAAGRQWLDLKSLTVPLLGSIMLRYEVARFARTLGTLLHNGVAMLKATDIAVGTVGNSLVRSSLSDLAPSIKRGGRLTNALDPRVFSPVALQMVRVGEESGALDKMLLELSQVYEAEVEADIKRALTLLEPALILGMGGVIALIIVGILMGILSVNTLVV